MSASIWKGTLSFGLLNIPVSLQTAQEEKELHFHMLDEKNMAPIKYKKVNQKTGHEVPSNRIVKAYEYEKGQYVTVTDKDFKAANVKATQTIDIEDFVEMEDIDTMMFERPYYLVPQKNGEKGYFLLRDALEKTGKVAIAKVVIRTKQHLCAVLPREDYLVLEILRFAHEVLDVHEVDYLDEVKKKKVNYNPKELKMAEELIKGMTAPWKPEKYKDTYYDDLKKRIEAKVEAGEGQELETPSEEVEEVKPTKVVDLLPLLRQSLEKKKSSSASHVHPAARARKRAGAHARPSTHDRRH